MIRNSVSVLLLVAPLAACHLPPERHYSDNLREGAPALSSPYYEVAGYPKYNLEDYEYEVTKKRKDGNVYTTTKTVDPEGYVVSERTTVSKAKKKD